MALIAVSISVMGQVTFTAIEGSDWTDAEGSAKAFDGNLNTKWCKGSSRYVDKCYLMLEASEATYIQGFKMTTANDNTDDRGRVPGEYTIFGSNNKTQWDVIYHQKEDNLIEDKNFTEYTVYCNSKQKYKYFKLWIKRNATRSYDLKNRLFQLSEFALLPAAFGMTLESGNAKAMDGDTGEKWEGKTPQTVVVKATSACQLIGYQFTTGNDNRLHPGRNPKDWTVEGSNDQQAWTIIDSKTDDKVMQDKNYYPYFFPVTPPETAYQYYRFTVTQSVDDVYFQMSELALKIIEKHNHKWKTTNTVAATCVAEGYEMQTCSICEATRKANVVPATGAHTYVDGICTVCGQIDPSCMTLNAEGIYELSTALQLKLWGKMIENGQHAVKAKLMADIDLKGTGFNGINIPEGSPSFSGELNGNGHWIQHMTLKGARNNLAFLSRMENAKIYDLGFRDARVELSGAAYNTSVIVGTAVSTEISRCAVMESSVRGYDHVAAFVGESKATTVISDCLAKAKIVSAKHQAGGLVGTSTGLTLTRCLFRGTVDNEELHASGILGLIDATDVPTRLSHNMVAADHIFSVRKWTHPLLQTSGKVCSLEANYTLATTLYGSPDSPSTKSYANPNDENGQQVTEDIAKSSAHYATTLGWDMENVWAHVDNDYPILRWMDESLLIKDASDWKRFCNRVKGGEKQLNAKLKADIDLDTDIAMVGDMDHPYMGTFDGEGHTLSIRWESDAKILAPFVWVGNATIKNLHVTGELTSDKSILSGLIAGALGETTLSGCSTDVMITNRNNVKESAAAGMVLFNDKDARLTITDCSVKGSITAMTDAAKKAMGGFVCDQTGTCTLNNCLYVGTNNAGNEGCYTFAANATLKNCYYLNPCGQPQEGTKLTEKQIKNGEAAKLLQANRTDRCYWTQQLGESPLLYRESDTNRGNNIYYDTEKAKWVCNNFYFSEQSYLPIGIDFTAARMEDDRTFPNESDHGFTMCLPFEYPIQGFKAYTLSGGDETTVRFKEVTGKLEAYHPYYILLEELGTRSGYDIQVKAFDAAALKTTIGSYTFVGTVDSLDNTAAAAANAYILQSDNIWHKVTAGNADVTIPAYRAYITTSTSGSTQALSIRFGDGSVTGLRTIETTDRDGTVRYYDLNGRYIGTSLEGQPRGVYLGNGKKIINK